MNQEIQEHIIFVLKDDNEVMRSALDTDSGLDEENRQMNIELILRHEQIINKVRADKDLTNEDLQIIMDANEIHYNDTENIAGHHKMAVELKNWLDKETADKHPISCSNGDCQFQNDSVCHKDNISIGDDMKCQSFIGDNKLADESKPYKIEFILDEGDFERSMGRKPLNQTEFDNWCCYAEKGLRNGHIDWNIIYECTKDAMPGGDD